MSPSLEVQIIAILVAFSCALPGVFLVLKKQAMMSDAISHTILLGIVIAFFFVGNLNSPILILGAALVGILTVFLSELIVKSRVVAIDASIGLISPFLFSIAVILITRFASGVHLDLDAVLLGELAFAPFDRLILFGIDFGAKSLYIMAFILILNIVFILLFYKELKLTTFDASFAFILGFSPVLINYLFMGLVSITAVSAFSAVGTILVISFMVGPPITASLLTQKLKTTIFLTLIIALINTILGFQISVIFDISIAGTLATTNALVFIFTLLFNRRGIIYTLFQRRKQKRIYTLYTMLFHLYHHEDTELEKQENSLSTIHHHLNWKQRQLNKMIYFGKKENLIVIIKDIIKLTECGRRYALDAYQELIDSI